MGGLFLLLLLLASIPLAFVAAVIHDKKELDKKEQDDIKWLENEKLQPKYRVGFLVNLNGNTLPIVTNTFEPTNSYAGSQYNMRYTSKMLAEIDLKNCYEFGYFTDEAGVTYPTCQIAQAWVEVANG